MPYRHVRVALGSAVALTTLLAAEPTLAMGLVGGSTFWLGLECNNDVIGQTIGASDPINGWQYTSDALGDNTDGHFYDILGLAHRETEDEIIIAINANTPTVPAIKGAALFDGDARHQIDGAEIVKNGRRAAKAPASFP